MFGLIATLVGGAIKARAQRKANAANIAASERANQLSGREARLAEQRAWKREMYRDQRDWKRHLQQNDPAYIRKKFEDAGINPLLGVAPYGGVGVPQAQIDSGHTPSVSYAEIQPTGSHFGDALARGFSSYDDYRNERDRISLATTELEMERQRLQDIGERISMRRPSVGIYGNADNQKTRDGLHSSAAGYWGTARSGYSIGSTSYIAPGREFEVAPYTSGPGLTEISNKITDYLGGPIVLPGADGEPWGFDEVLTAFSFGAPQLFYRDLKRRIQNDKQMLKNAYSWMTTTSHDDSPPAPRQSSPSSGWMTDKFGTGLFSDPKFN